MTDNQHTPGMVGRYERVTEYTVSALPEGFTPDAHHWDLTVAYRGDGRWAVLRGPYCLNAQGDIDHEPQPSSREDDWLAEHRFSLADALRIAHENAPKVVVNGLTPADLAAKYPQANPPDSAPKEATDA